METKDNEGNTDRKPTRINGSQKRKLMKIEGKNKEHERKPWTPKENEGIPIKQ